MSIGSRRQRQGGFRSESTITHAVTIFPSGDQPRESASRPRPGEEVPASSAWRSGATLTVEAMPAVNPEILVWARQTAGLTLGDAVMKVGIRDARGVAAVDRLAALERGEREPTRPVLVKMAQHYRRPLLAFYLTAPPRRGDRGADFRTPVEMYEEVLAGKDDELTRWLKDHRDALLLDENVDGGLVAEVTARGYAPDLSDEEVERVGRDPFLIAYALGAPLQRVVVTTEHSKPRKQRANRHIPDVCRALGVHCCNTYEFIEALDFTTGWRR